MISSTVSDLMFFQVVSNFVSRSLSARFLKSDVAVWDVNTVTAWPKIFAAALENAAPISALSPPDFSLQGPGHLFEYVSLSCSSAAHCRASGRWSSASSGRRSSASCAARTRCANAMLPIRPRAPSRIVYEVTISSLQASPVLVEGGNAERCQQLLASCVDLHWNRAAREEFVQDFAARMSEP